MLAHQINPNFCFRLVELILAAIFMGKWRGFRKRLYQLVKKGVSLVKGLDRNSFILAMEPNVVAIEEDSLDSVSRNAGNAKDLSIGCAHYHDWHDRDAWPERFCCVAYS